MSAKRINFLYGPHGAGKTYLSKKLGNYPSSLYWNADIRESKYWDKVSKLNICERQYKFIEYNRNRILELKDFLKRKQDINHVYVDFGPHQILSYLRLFGMSDLYNEWKKESNDLLKMFKDEYDILIFYVDPGNEIIKNNIINRKRKEKEWELETVDLIRRNLKKEIRNIDKKFHDINIFYCIY
jgi:hypothetical protein